MFKSRVIAGDGPEGIDGPWGWEAFSEVSMLSTGAGMTITVSLRIGADG